MNGSLLIKFGKKEHLLQLQKEGIVYCNSIKWFAGLKDESLRGDEYEAVIRTQYMENTVFQLREADDPNSQWKNLKVNHAQFKEYHKEPLGNLYCLSDFKFDFNDNKGEFQIDKGKFLPFGDSFLLILHQPDFFARFKKGLSDANLEYCEGHVQYLDLKKYSGKKGLYQKDTTYSYQQEYRIHIHTEHSNPVLINIENIEDISLLYDLESFQGFQLKQGRISDASST